MICKLWSSCLGFSVLNTALIYTTDTTVIHPANEYIRVIVWTKTPEKATFRHAHYYYDNAYTLHTCKQRVFGTYLLTCLIKTTLQYENMISYKMITKMLQSFTKILFDLVWWQMWNIDSYYILMTGSPKWNTVDISLSQIVPSYQKHWPDISYVTALKTESRHGANFVFTGGAAGCHYDNLRCPQWR